MNDSIDTLDELLNDPIVRLVMERDRVEPAEIRMLLEQVRNRAIEESHVPPAHMVPRTRPKPWLCP
jgi:hypothetical protein